MPIPENPLELARSSFDQRAWGVAFDAFVRADSLVPLDRDDLERLVWTAALRGRNAEFLGALERLHKACLDAGETKRAARAAFWLGFHLSSLGSPSGGGWLARARRLVEHEPACVEHGYLLLPTVYLRLAIGDDAAAAEAANQGALIGERCDDRDLVALARHLEGRALVRQGRISEGLSLLDEVMAGATAGELSLLVTGIVYCSAIVTCQEAHAFDRARDWTAALARWCSEQPQLVTFTGLCLVRRAEILQLGGAWEAATAHVRLARERCSDADPEALGDACYQEAELLRFRGDFTGAQNAYRLANDNGREPQPGLALLRLAQGRVEPAIRAIRRALSTTTVAWRRARLLPAFVDIMLAAGRRGEAREAARELERMASAQQSVVLGAMAAHARGAVAVADQDFGGAYEPLRHSFEVWHRLGAPYIAARVRVLLSRALVGLGDLDSAALERDAARRVFEELGAAPDLASLDASAMSVARSRHGLSGRELEVLRLVARGKTNRAIAHELFLSERTVDRHLSNIFTKIGVATRTAATAFAYENALV
jgi:DNA-binding NarL/FixJ family response regulator